jgi:hypothetical protein
VIAELDLLADRDAACAFAEMQSDDRDRTSYLEAFQEALFFSVNYFFETFDFSKRSRPHKVLRSVGVFIMMGRLLATQDHWEEDYAVPLDSTISLRGMTISGPYLLFAEQPWKQLLMVATDAEAALIGDIIEAVEQKDMGLALGLSEALANEQLILAA